ncbi:hypothetical protein MMC13_007672 [Lambiella insularis]|nr:hypothetical protein [Lambiella insularis]
MPTFFDLPLEIRQEIYRFTLAINSDKKCFVSVRYHDSLCGKGWIVYEREDHLKAPLAFPFLRPGFNDKPADSLLRINRQIRAEAEELLYSRLIFDFRVASCGDLQTFKDSISRRARTSIQHVKFQMCFRDDGPAGMDRYLPDCCGKTLQLFAAELPALRTVELAYIRMAWGPPFLLPPLPTKLLDELVLEEKTSRPTSPRTIIQQILDSLSELPLAPVQHWRPRRR